MLRYVSGFILVVFLAVVILPLTIVKSCGSPFHFEDEVTEGRIVKVYNKAEDKVMELYMEEYVKGVVAAEMPAEFEIEALKAQAVAARTNAYRMMLVTRSEERLAQHKGGDICTDFAHCQAWISREDAQSKWGFFSAQKNWDKIAQAVEDTRGIVMAYNNRILEEPLFHACSDGTTENAEDVFLHGEPYLVSVPTEGDEESPNYYDSKTFTRQELLNKLAPEYPDIAFESGDIAGQIKIHSRTKAGRVKEIMIGNRVIPSTKLRALLGLRSTSFTVTVKGDKITFDTTGDGHGVGMSQWGANGLAKNGENYQDILKHYYKGITLVKID